MPVCVQDRRPSDGEVEAALEKILKSSEFQREKSLLEEVFEWFGERMSFEVSSGFARGLLWIVAVLLALLGIFLLVRFMPAGRRARRRSDEAHSGPSVASRLAQLRREAREARTAGDLRLALRKQFFALVLGLGTRGDLEFRAAWTNRELLRRGRPSPEIAALLEPLVVEFERKEFGNEPVDERDLDRLEALYVEHLGARFGEAAA